MSFLQHVIKIPEAVIIVAQFGELEILGVLLASTWGSFGPGAVPQSSDRPAASLALKFPLAPGRCAACGRDFLLGGC